MFAIKTTLRSIGLGAVLVAAALSARAATVHYVVDVDGTANDFWGDITVSSLDAQIYSSSPTAITATSSQATLSITSPNLTFGGNNSGWYIYNDGSTSKVQINTSNGGLNSSTWQNLISNNSGQYSITYSRMAFDSVTVGGGNQGTVTYSATPVPAPLPILGAVAAFGWSRKLRRRIRESQAHA